MYTFRNAEWLTFINETILIFIFRQNPWWSSALSTFCDFWKYSRNRSRKRKSSTILTARESCGRILDTYRSKQVSIKAIIKPTFPPLVDGWLFLLIFSSSSSVKVCNDLRPFATFERSVGLGRGSAERFSRLGKPAAWFWTPKDRFFLVLNTFSEVFDGLPSSLDPFASSFSRKVWFLKVSSLSSLFRGDGVLYDWVSITISEWGAVKSPFNLWAHKIEYVCKINDLPSIIAFRVLLLLVAEQGWYVAEGSGLLFNRRGSTGSEVEFISLVELVTVIWGLSEDVIQQKNRVSTTVLKL